jgi:hypothetical protein
VSAQTTPERVSEQAGPDNLSLGLTDGVRVHTEKLRKKNRETKTKFIIHGFQNVLEETNL